MARGQRRTGQVVERGPGKWLLRVALGRDGSGKRLYKNETFLGTSTQAQKRLTELTRSRDTHSLVLSSKLPLSDYLDRWLDGRIDVTDRTRESYRYQLRYITQYLGALKLTDLTTRHVQESITKMTEESGLAPRTVEYCVRVLHIALGDAVKQNLIVRNPAQDVRLPKKVKRAPTVLSMKEIAKLLESAKEDRLYPLWCVLLDTGMRPGEAFALRWSDVDLETKWVAIDRALTTDGKGRAVISNTPKAGSKRRLGMGQSAVDALRALKKTQRTEMLKAGERYDRASDLIFCRSLGQPLNIDQVRRQWKEALKTAKLPEVRLYDARHSHLTAMLASGSVDIALLSARAGHRDISTTIKHYAHVLPESQRMMGDLSEQLLAKARQK